jgi:hypothetical protein
MSSNTEIIQAIQGLRVMLESLEARVSSVTAAPKVSTAPATQQTKTEPKPEADQKPKREISEATKAWNAYVTKVKEDMISSGWKHPETGNPATRKDAMQEASKRRPTDPDAPKPTEAKPKPKPKTAAEPSHPAAADGEAKPKPVRKPRTEEQKAETAAKRKATLERKKAETEAAKASTPSTYPPLPPSPLPEKEDKGETLTPINIKAKKYLLNPHTNGCWKRNADGSKGEWAGVYAKVDGKDTIDASVGERAFD